MHIIPRRSNLYARVLVLNRNYVPIKVVSARKAFTMLFKEYADALDLDGDKVAEFNIHDWTSYSQMQFELNPDGNLFVRSPKQWYLVPRVIRLYKYDRVPKFDIPLTKRNLLIRDDFTCQYCGKKLGPTTMSMDHIIPKSKGGKTVWSNVVLSCKQCNTKKSSRRLSRSGLKLLKHPTVPTRMEFLHKELKDENVKIWSYFLKF